MSKIDNHPTVRRIRESASATATPALASITAEELKQWCLECGADDVGLVSINRAELDDQRDDILTAASWTKTLVSFVCKMNREPVRSPMRSLANREFYSAGEHVDEVSRELVTRLEEHGIRAVNPSMGFPMEADKFPGKIWVVSHKPVAVAAGLGQMGIHRNVIHPKFGNFILLGTVLVDLPIEEEASSVEGAPIDYNPCLDCKLCVAACPVGAIAPNGDFDFTSCYTHNYREFMGGFNDWVENVAASKSRNDYRSRFSDGETTSMWQSLSFGANYKAAHCIAVCPAGEDVIAPWLEDRKGFMNETLRPLQDREETVFVIPGSDAQAHVEKHFPHKPTKIVRGSLFANTIEKLLQFMPLVFQPGQAKGLTATYHFTFTGEEQRQATMIIDDQKLTVLDGHQGERNLLVTADSRTFLRFLSREVPLAWALLTLRIRLRGSPFWLVKFGKCFPS